MLSRREAGLTAQRGTLHPASQHSGRGTWCQIEGLRKGAGAYSSARNAPSCQSTTVARGGQMEGCEERGGA